MKSQTPLALKNLLHDRRRLATAVAGIGFAVLLMFVQVGFQNALYDSQVRLIDALSGDLFVVSRNRFAIAAETRFPLQRLVQAQSAAGVAEVYPVYTELTASVFRNFGDPTASKGYQIRSIGIHPDQPVFKMPGVAQNAGKLRQPQTAIVDELSKPSKYALPVGEIAALEQADVEVGGRHLRLVGTFELGTDFVNEGNLIMSSSTFAGLFPHRVPGGDPLSIVDLGVVELADSADATAVSQQLRQLLGDQVDVYTREEFGAKEKLFWRRNTPIGAVFSAGKVLGFIVGVVICYQVIFTGIADHMPEYATLKAMGYGWWYFIHLIIVEAFWLALFGFVPGALISTGLYRWLAEQTGLLMQMTPGTLLSVLLFTVLMCVASGLLAVRKLLTADPASLF